ncbi:hypothetical protein EAH89_24030 [Roseomonas nepalensis]|uniref:Uncharacterized protein n=1 Tax=Muricoccus nepalensis TaxID=1854500 RepID=A0A502FCE6_9PROT|nr:hypothetical protein [Roseomonas nepalensis]TPG47060.1 hypothetical protein EAH89_24030 [Roseomonas nepalensis]
MTPPAIRFRSAEDAAAALAAAEGLGAGLLLLSAPAAAAWPGAAVVAAMLARAAARHPGTPFRAALDCGSAPGLALDALRQGWRLLVLDGAHPAFPAVRAAAAEAGADILPAAPPALDLARLDLRREAGRALLARHLRGAAGEAGRVTDTAPSVNSGEDKNPQP